MSFEVLYDQKTSPLHLTLSRGPYLILEPFPKENGLFCSCGLACENIPLQVLLTKPLRSGAGKKTRVSTSYNELATKTSHPNKIIILASTAH